MLSRTQTFCTSGSAPRNVVRPDLFTASGELDEAEQRWIERVFEFGYLRQNLRVRKYPTFAVRSPNATTSKLVGQEPALVSPLEAGMNRPLVGWLGPG